MVVVQTQCTTANQKIKGASSKTRTENGQMVTTAAGITNLVDIYAKKKVHVTAADCVVFDLFCIRCVNSTTIV